MRIFLHGTVTTLAVLLASHAHAEQVPVTSHIESVTVFPDGALVTRAAEIDIGTGASELVFKNLPNELDATSLRVSGIADSDLAIDSVVTRHASVERRPDGANEAQLKELKAEREEVQSALDSLEAKKAMALRFAKADPKELASDAKPLAVTDWPTAFDTVATALLKTNEDIRLQRAKARELDAKIRVLEQVITAGNGNFEPRREVLIQVHTKDAVKGRVLLTYRVANAVWRPVYDARLETNGANRKPSLTLIRRATVSQSTGENWDDVALSVSTVRSTRSTSAPNMETQRLAFVEIEPAEAARAMPASPPHHRALSKPVPMDAAKLALQPQVPAPPPEPSQPATETTSQLEAGDFQAAFVVPGHISLAADSVTKTFSIASRVISPDLVIKSVPALDQTAYVESHFVNDEEAPLLPGQVALYRNANYVGTGSIGFVASGENLDLGFGADDRVKVTRVPVKRKENEPNWLGQTKTEAREYKTTVKNLHDFPVKITIIDQIPISENTAITIEQLPATTAPTEKIVADKRGVMSWTYDYAAGQAREVHLAYRMKWPADRDVISEQVSSLAK